MRIKWLGHSCFKISSEKGIRILTDPFDDNVGYKLPAVETDIITLSHGHYDHNFIECVKGNFEVISKVGNFYVKDIAITGVHTFHDDEQGAKRGNNIVYIFDIDGIRVCHMGDIGHALSPSQVQLIGAVDILMMPAGGVFTVNWEGALEIVNQLNPSVVIPMHYKTSVLKFNLETADEFISKFENVVRLQSQVVEIKKADLKPGEKKLYVLRYE